MSPPMPPPCGPGIGFFSFSGKVTAFAAPLAIGVVTAATGSERIGIGMSLIFLIGGLILLQWVRDTNAGSGAYR